MKLHLRSPSSGPADGGRSELRRRNDLQSRLSVLTVILQPKVGRSSMHSSLVRSSECGTRSKGPACHVPIHFPHLVCIKVPEAAHTTESHDATFDNQQRKSLQYLEAPFSCVRSDRTETLSSGSSSNDRCFNSPDNSDSFRPSRGRAELLSLNRALQARSSSQWVVPQALLGAFSAPQVFRYR